MVPAELKAKRLDQALAQLVPDMSRSRLKQLIEQGQVQVAGQIVTQPKHKVAEGDTLNLEVPPPEESLHLLPEDIPLDIVFEDDDLIIINKAAGMVVHPAAGNPSGTLVNALLHHCGNSLKGIGGVVRPGIVHRLDKDTSGLMVVAKAEHILADLQEQFADRTIERAYDAFVWGQPQAKFEINENIGRSRTNRQKMAVLDEEHGKPALTRVSRLALFGLSASWVQCRLATGRTHQIRVHMSHVGHSLIGDPAYGRATPARRRSFTDAQNETIAGFDRQALHARILGFEHPATGEWLRFEQACPQDMQDLAVALSGLEWEEVEAIAHANQPDPDEEQSAKTLTRRGYFEDEEDDGVDVYWAY